MNLYSHIVLASNLEEPLRPENAKEYYLGAVVPDIRYLCGWRRRQTHLSMERIAEFAAQYPHLGSFILGYQVHCLIDEFNSTDCVVRFPATLLVKRLPKQSLPVLIETFYLMHRAVERDISESSNEILESLGVAPATLAVFSTQVNAFLSAPSLDTWIGLAQTVSVSNKASLEQYTKAAQVLRRHWVLRELLFGSMDMVRLEHNISQYVLGRLDQEQLIKE